MQKIRISSSGISAIIRRKDLMLLLESGAEFALAAVAPFLFCKAFDLAFFYKETLR